MTLLNLYSVGTGPHDRWKKRYFTLTKEYLYYSKSQQVTMLYIFIYVGTTMTPYINRIPQLIYYIQYCYLVSKNLVIRNEIVKYYT